MLLLYSVAHLFQNHRIRTKILFSKPPNNDRTWRNYTFDMQASKFVMWGYKCQFVNSASGFELLKGPHWLLYDSKASFRNITNPPADAVKVHLLIVFFLQDWRSSAHRLLLLCGGAGTREEGRAPQLALHVLDDWRDLRLSYGLGHHPTLWSVTTLCITFCHAVQPIMCCHHLYCQRVGDTTLCRIIGTFPVPDCKQFSN